MPNKDQIKVHQVINTLLLSNTYIVHNSNCCCIIDPGDIKPLQDYIKQNKLTPTAILLTHYHFDHIYGLPKLQDIYKNTPIYCSHITKEGVLNDKINMSIYNQTPLNVKDVNIKTFDTQENIEIWENQKAETLYTPGHNDDCHTYIIDKNMFTGDTLIPNYKIHTKSKKADKTQAQQSIDHILNSFSPENIIYPGHHQPCTIKELL